MARVRAFQIEGVYCWFYSDDHEPPHFHAKREGEWEVKVRFLQPRASMFEYQAWSLRKMSRRHWRSLCEETESHREALLAQWEEVRGGRHA